MTILLERLTCVQFGPRSGRKRRPKNHYPKPPRPWQPRKQSRRVLRLSVV